MAKPAVIPPIDATPEELARMLLQPPKAEKPQDVDKVRSEGGKEDVSS